MTRASVLPFRRMTLWTALLCLVILAFAVAACGDGGSTATPSSSNSNSALSSLSSSSTPAPSLSGKMVTITITEKSGGHHSYNFDPQTITIKAGTTVKWVNASGENHLLSSKMASVFTTSSMVPRSGSKDNTYEITFTTPGTYIYTSTLVHKINHLPEGMTSSAMGTITVIA